MLHIASLISVGVAMVLYAVSGVVAITTNRMVAWQRRAVLRPRLWGGGALALAGGLGLVRCAGSVRDLTAADVLFPAGLLLLLTGALLQILGRRPGRTAV
ncbi:hypothetical protein ABZ845_18940 [Streptomyces sp. NPDC047022]|uniref:hypothetical protein n=1 Tax=Streptomyces sp. NPDC047022 TaxID=3155737 RepID=UPI00340B96FC